MKMDEGVRGTVEMGDKVAVQEGRDLQRAKEERDNGNVVLEEGNTLEKKHGMKKTCIRL